MFVKQIENSFPPLKMRTMNLKEGSVCGRIRDARADSSDDDRELKS